MTISSCSSLKRSASTNMDIEPATSAVVDTASYQYKYDRLIYKKVDSTKLELLVFYPRELDSLDSKPAIVFFFGGGWQNGGKTQFINHAKYFSRRGLVSILADYRIESKHNTTPFDALEDAKSAMRFIRSNASMLGVDEQRIIASGASAGGHLAAATALIDGFNARSDDRSVSSVPNALVLFNPVIDNGPNGYGHKRIGDKFIHFSPYHNIKKGAPPTIIFVGSEDIHLPTKTLRRYKRRMEKVDSRCEVQVYKGENHGFWNYRYFKNYKKTILEADEFIQSLGFLSDKPLVEIN